MANADETVRKVGQLLRERRLKLGLTQRDVGKMAGYSNVFISKIESGKYNFTWDTLVKVLAALKWKVWFIDANFGVNDGES